MAGVRQGFVTGARAKIIIGGQTMAFATDVSYNVTIQTIPIETMGKFEVHTNEPVAYNVDGSFSVVRYTGDSAQAANIKDAAGNIAAKPGTGPASNTNTLGVLSSGTAPGDNLNPSMLLQSSTFDIQIKEKDVTGSSETDVFRINDCRITRRGATLNKRGVLVDSYAFVGILAGDTDTTDALEVTGSSM
jgi:hypothetical protein